MNHRQRLHREHDPRTRRTLAAALLISTTLVGLALGVVALQVGQVRLAYRLDAARGERARLAATIGQLEIETASLRSPGQVEARARELGMSAPGRDQVRLAREYVTGASGVAAAKLARVEALLR